jgi:hypothetical protein
MDTDRRQAINGSSCSTCRGGAVQRVSSSHRAAILMFLALTGLFFPKSIRANDESRQTNHEPIAKTLTTALDTNLSRGFPTPGEILRAQFHQGQSIDRARCELIAYKVSAARAYPLVGPARLVHAHFKYTFTADGRTETVYIDIDRLVRDQ